MAINLSGTITLNDAYVSGTINVTGDTTIGTIGNVKAFGGLDVKGILQNPSTSVATLTGLINLKGIGGITVDQPSNVVTVAYNLPPWPASLAVSDVDVSGFTLYASVGNVNTSGELNVNTSRVDYSTVIECTSDAIITPPFWPCILDYTIIGGGGGGGGGGVNNLSSYPPCGGGGSSGMFTSGTILLTSGNVITLSCGAGGTGAAAVAMLGNGVAGGNGGRTSVYSYNFFDTVSGGLGGGSINQTTFNVADPSAEYGGGGAGSRYSPTQNGRGGDGAYPPILSAAGGGGYGQFRGGGGAGSGLWGSQYGGAPGAGVDASDGGGVSLYGYGAGSSEGKGGGNVGGSAVGTAYGGGGGGISVVGIAAGGTGGRGATITTSSQPGYPGVAGGGGGGGGGGFTLDNYVTVAEPASAGGNGGNGAARFVFTTLCNL